MLVIVKFEEKGILNWSLKKIIVVLYLVLLECVCLCVIVFMILIFGLRVGSIGGLRILLIFIIKFLNLKYLRLFLFL